MGCREKLNGLKVHLKDRVMLILNLIAISMIIVCIVYRFVYVGKKEEKNIFFMILTIFLALFIIILTLAEFQVRIVRKYFNFLDGKVGRGFFIFFIGLLILAKTNAIEIIFSIFILLIALLNILVGWN